MDDTADVPDDNDPRLDAIAAREVRMFKDRRNRVFLESVISLMLETGDSMQRVASILRDHADDLENFG